MCSEGYKSSELLGFSEQELEASLELSKEIQRIAKEKKLNFNQVIGGSILTIFTYIECLRKLLPESEENGRRFELMTFCLDNFRDVLTMSDDSVEEILCEVRRMRGSSIDLN